MIKWLCDTDANPDKLRNSNHDFEGLWLTVREWLAFAILAMFIMKPSSAAPLLDRINPNNSESVNSWSLSQIRVLLNAFFCCSIIRSPPKCSFIDWMVSRKFPRLARRQKWLFAICAPEKLQFVQISSFVREAVVMMVMVVIKMMVIQKCYETYDIII